MNKNDACHHNKWDNIPMIFFLTNLSFVVEQMQFYMESEISVVIIVDEATGAIFYDKIHSLVIVNTEHNP